MSMIHNTQTGIEMLYRGIDLQRSEFEDNLVCAFNEVCDQLELDPITNHIDYSLEFVIPDYYKQLDIRSHIYEILKHKSSTVDENILDRVNHELELFEARKLFPVLQALIYIVDTMKRNNIVWGVGRGSSVASYCLYLLEVHRIDSIKYNLDIREFLR